MHVRARLSYISQRNATVLRHHNSGRNEAGHCVYTFVNNIPEIFRQLNKKKIVRRANEPSTLGLLTIL